MAHFVKGGAVQTPFGKNVYLRHTSGCKFESYSLAASLVPVETINGVGGQKILQPGTLLVKITAGAESGKVAPYRAGAINGQGTLTGVVGINDTFLPWQLMEHDEQVGVLTEGTVVQAWCFELDAAGLRIPLSNTTVDTFTVTVGKEENIFRSKRLDIKFA